MKTQKITFGLVTIIMAGSIMFTSCKKPKRENDTDTNSAGDHSYAENAANDLVSMGDQAAVGGTLSTYKLSEGSPSNTYFTACATISLYNNPELNNNKTGTKKVYNKSKWCIKHECKNELEYLIKNTKARCIILSYNNEGIISIDEIEQIFKKYGTYIVFDVGRT